MAPRASKSGVSCKTQRKYGATMYSSGISAILGSSNQTSSKKFEAQSLFQTKTKDQKEKELRLQIQGMHFTQFDVNI
jgi:hypothetical protein